MIHVAAVGDIHFGPDAAGTLRPHLEHLNERADLLLLAGDLTRHGTVDEARCVATEFGGLPVPVIAVLGNHDYHSDQVPEVTGVLALAEVLADRLDDFVLINAAEQNLNWCRRFEIAERERRQGAVRDASSRLPS